MEGSGCLFIYLEGSYHDSMFWGSYRPGIYFGMKTRAETPIMTGLMWSPAYNFKTLRHNCRHGLFLSLSLINKLTGSKEDHLKKYGWVMHNGKDFGRHEMIDPQLNGKITAQFVKESPDHEVYTLYT